MSIERNLHVDSSPGLHHYNMILGHDIMSELGITLDFKDQTVTWDDSTINIKDPKSLLDILDPVNDFFWSNDHYETEALQEASACLQKILDATYTPADLDVVVQACRRNCMLYLANTNIYLMALWERNNKPYNIELKEGAKLYHSRPFPVPKIHERTLKVELDRLVKLGVLKQINASKWATPTFIISKKDATVRFISNFVSSINASSVNLSQFQRFKTCY